MTRGSWGVSSPRARHSPVRGPPRRTEVSASVDVGAKWPVPERDGSGTHPPSRVVLATWVCSDLTSCLGRHP